MQKGDRIKKVKNRDYLDLNQNYIGGEIAHVYPEDHSLYPGHVIVRLDWKSNCVRRAPGDVEV
jgi:hypothetical protein